MKKTIAFMAAVAMAIASVMPNMAFADARGSTATEYIVKAPTRMYEKIRKVGYAGVHVGDGSTRCNCQTNDIVELINHNQNWGTWIYVRNRSRHYNHTSFWCNVFGWGCQCEGWINKFYLNVR